MGEGTGGVARLPSPPGRGVGGEGVQLLSVNQGCRSQLCPYALIGSVSPQHQVEFLFDVGFSGLNTQIK